MSRFQRLFLIGFLTFSLVQLMGATAFGQHGGGCSCAACTGRQLSLGNSFPTPSKTSSADVLESDSFSSNAFGSNSKSSNSSNSSNSFSSIGQTVFLDFDSGTDGSIKLRAVHP